MGNRDVLLCTSHKSTVRNTCSLKDGAGYGLFLLSEKTKALYKLTRRRSLLFLATI